MEGQISHDQVTRMLNQSHFSSKDLWKWVQSDVRKAQNQAEGVLILDDRIEEKPYTDENEIVCWHYSHAKGTHVKGMNLLSCLVSYGDLSYPVGDEILHKDVEYLCPKEHPLKRRSAVTKNELFRSLIEQTNQNQIAYQYVLADNWFGSKENFEFIHQKKKFFIIGIKSNRTVALSQSDKKDGFFKKVSELHFKENTAIQVYLKGIEFPVQLIKKVFINENGTQGTLYLVSNDLNNSADHLYSIYQKRWKIEEYVRQAKRNQSNRCKSDLEKERPSL